MDLFKPHSNFKWKKNAKFFSKGKLSWFTPHSFIHFTSGIIFFFIIKILFKLNNFKSILIINIIHIIEDFLENTSLISIESILAKIINCKNKLFISTYDEDSIQNYIGDNISFFLGSLVGYFIFKNKIIKQNVHKYIIIIFISYILSFIIVCKYMNYKKKIENRTKRKKSGIIK